MNDVAVLSGLYGACAVAYAALLGFAAWQKTQHSLRYLYAGACCATMLWAASISLAWSLPTQPLVQWLDIARLGVWYGFILRSYQYALDAREQIRTIFRPLGFAILLLIMAASVLAHMQDPGGLFAHTVKGIAQIGFPVCCLLLLENLYRNTPADLRWNVNLLCLGLGTIFVYDLILYTDAALFHRLSLLLVEARAPVTMLAAPLLAIAMVRNRRWRVEVRVSHDVAFHSFTLIGSGVFLLAVALIGEVLRSGGSKWGGVAELTLLFAAILTVSVIVTSGTARSRIRGLVIHNFFASRYDYRKEWMRCITTLTAPEAFVALHKRAIQAAAEVVDSPAGALFVRPPEDVAFQWGGSWNMPAALAPIAPGHELVTLFRGGDWIVNLDEHSDWESWFPELPRLWLILPLSHFGAVIGFIALARPRAHFKLDREAYDLLRVVGHEIASRVAEQRVAQVLAQTGQLREYSQRFAFVIHDIKNVSGQLSMLLSNAEVHADNPAFQRDMLATVRASVGKITRLLTRLEAERQEREHAVVTPAQRVRVLAEQCQRSRGHEIGVQDTSRGAGAAIDPDAFDAVVTHLLNNAAEASPPGKPVLVALRQEAAGIVIDITDQGAGMLPEFVRDELFRPLRSTKSDGHGIGAFQSRELLREAGGDLLVLTRAGAGTTMRIILPSVRAHLTEPVEA